MNNGEKPIYPTEVDLFGDVEKTSIVDGSKDGVPFFIGLTKREYFAAKAIQGLLSHTIGNGLRGKEDYARKAIEIADELLKQLEQ